MPDETKHLFELIEKQFAMKFKLMLTRIVFCNDNKLNVPVWIFCTSDFNGVRFVQWVHNLLFLLMAYTSLVGVVVSARASNAVRRHIESISE